MENSPGWSVAQPGECPPIKGLRPVGALRNAFVYRERSAAETGIPSDRSSSMGWDFSRAATHPQVFRNQPTRLSRAHTR